MKYILSVFALFLLILNFSCSPSQEEMQKKISELEDQLQKSEKADTIKVSEMIGAYQNYAERFPSDSLSPKYLYKAGGMATGFNRGEQALEIYQKIIQKYPTSDLTAESMFMKAFVYENVLKNLGKASDSYKEFISKYPNHELTDDATASLKFLGKTPEEMVKEFEKMNADSAASETM